MAIENAKFFNVRIKNKYDSYENWMASGLVLEAGEIAIAHTAVNTVAEDGVNKVTHPALLMKVGDGVKTFAQLPWLSAKAADVLSVCKNEAELTTFVNNVIADAGIASDDAMEALAARVTTAEGAIDVLEALVGTDSVQAQITAKIEALNLATTYEKVGVAKSLVDPVSAKANANEAALAILNGEATVEGSLAKAKADAIAHADGLDEAMDTRVKALEDMFGEGEGTVETQIENAIAQEVIDRNAAIEEAVGAEADEREALEDRVKAIEDDYLVEADKTELSNAISGVSEVAEKAKADIEAFMSAAEVGEAAVDTLKEIQGYIESDAAAADKMVKDIAANAKAIEDEAALARQEEGKLAERIVTLENANKEGGEVAAAIAEAKAAADAAQKDVDDLAAQMPIDIATAKGEAIAEATTLAGNAEAAAKAHAEEKVQELADGAVKDNADAIAVLNGEGEGSVKKAQADAEAHADELVAGLDSEVEVSTEEHVLTGVTQVDGKLTAVKEVKLAKVGFSGLINDLGQDEAITLVFDCGTSAE